MRGWLSDHRGALATLLALPLAVVLFAITYIGLAVSASYHPMAPVAYQLPFLIGLMILTLVLLTGLAIWHATPARRGRLWRNLAELGGLTLAFVLTWSLISTVVQPPKFAPRVLFGQTYNVPTVYRPTIWHDEDRRDRALVIDVCGPDDAPYYAARACRLYAMVRYGDEVFFDDFHINLILEAVSADRTGDSLHNPGNLQPGAGPGEWVYLGHEEELRLWQSPEGQVDTLRHCRLAYGQDCTAMVRIGDRTIVFPIHDMAAMASLPALRAAGQAWVDRMESWRCGTGAACPGKTE